MRILLMLTVLVVAVSQQPAPAPQKAQPGAVGSIQGVVQQESTKTGIPDVEISVTFQPPVNGVASPSQLPTPPAQQPRATTLQTDASGHFELKNLAPGSYIIQAQREGYMSGANQLSGTARPTVISATSVIADQTSRVTLSMIRGATVSGRITDANGNSVVNTTIAAFQKGYQDGRPVLLGVLTKQTDDHGEYRLFWLTLGEYYIGVLPGAGARGARGGLPGSVPKPQFYPGVIDAKTATRIKVDEGADITGIGITLQTIPSGVTVSGSVVNLLPNIPTGPRGQPPNLGARQFYLVPLDPTALTESNTAAIQNTAGGARGGGSTDFQITGVLPGSYDLIALVADEQGRPFPGRERIDVGNQDVSGITITVHPGAEVKGHMSVRGNGTAAVTLPFLRVQLRPADGTPAFAVNNALNPQVAGARGPIGGVVSAQDPSLFTYPNVPDGHYLFQVLPLPASAYIEDIREGSRSIYDSGLTIENGNPPGEIQIILNSDGETVVGTVLDAAQRTVVAFAHVVLVPVPSRRQNPNLYKTATSNEMGKFSISGVAPGDYKLFAWEDVPNGAWQNEEFMTKYEVLGTAIKVAAGIRNDPQLRVIPAGQ